MLFEELIPHLNKIATLYLTNNRRRVGWLFTDSAANESQEEIYFINVMKGRRMLEAPRATDLEKLKKVREKIPLNDIVRVRSISS
jgi:hypothetical protein